MKPVARQDHMVLLGSHTPLCERIKRAGLTLVVIDAAATVEPAALALADHLVLTDYTDSERMAGVIGALVGSHALVGVLSLTERGLLPAAEINALLGVDDNPVTVIRRVVDKAVMRAWLARDKRFAVAAATVSTPEELRAFADESGFPLVIKPPNGVGSSGVRVVHDAGDVTPDLLVGHLPLLAEPYLEGREFSVEAISHEGRHVIVGITEKFVVGAGVNRFVEVGHRFPAALDRHEMRTVSQFVSDFLDRVGLQRGLSHTEVIMGDAGPSVIETHSRNGGDHIVDLVRLATGFDMLDAAVRARAGLIDDLPAVPTPARAAAIRYFTAAPGVVRDVVGVDPARSVPGVVDLELKLRRGDTVAPLTCSSDRVGYVIAVGSEGDAAVQSCADAVEMVQITTEEVP
jgi:biotin carboxylase